MDVGYGQLAWSLRSDSRVVVMERTNARALTPDMFPELMDMAVMDLSFISVRLVLPGGVYAAQGRRPVVCLIKPQFEAGREDVGKKASCATPLSTSACCATSWRQRRHWATRSWASTFARARTGGQHRISRISQKGQL